MEPTHNLKNPSIGKAIASLVLGIVAVICVFWGWGASIGVILGGLLGFIGLIFGIKAKKESSSAIAQAGIVITIIAIAICGIGIWACVSLVRFGVAIVW